MQGSVPTVHEFRQGLPAPVAQRVRDVHVFAEIDSTNGFLLHRPAPPPGQADVCYANFQREGRGRRGRRWLAPPGACACVSVAWQFVTPPENAGALGLATGVAAWRALTRLGYAGIGLKWPNDIVAEGRKLGGVLVESAGQPGGPLHVVAGIGVNLALPEAIRNRIVADGGMEPGDLGAVGPSLPAPEVAAAIVAETVTVLVNCDAHGLAGVLAQWREADVLIGKEVEVQDGSGRRTGLAEGIADDGALLVRSGDSVQALRSADVTVRPR